MAKTKGNSFEARENKSRKRSSIVKMSELREENKQIINTPSQAEIKQSPSNTEVIDKEVQSSVVQHTNVAPKVEVKTNEAPKAFIPEVKSEAINRDLDLNNTSTTQVVEPVKEKVVEPSVVNNNLTTDVIKTNLEIEEVTVPEATESVVKDTSAEDDLKDILMVGEPITEKTQVITSKENKSHVDINDDFFNLNIKNDVFNGKITTVRVYDDILDKMKKYANMKNYQIIEFTNKVITMGLDDITNFGVLEISEIKLKNNTSRSIMYNLTDTMDEKLTKYIKLMHKKGYKISRNVILNVVLNETLKKFY